MGRTVWTEYQVCWYTQVLTHPSQFLYTPAPHSSLSILRSGHRVLSHVSEAISPALLLPLWHTSAKNEALRMLLAPAQALGFQCAQ